MLLSTNRQKKEDDKVGNDCNTIDLIVKNLQDSGCDCATINKFIELQKEGQCKEQLLLLAPFRKNLLKSIHCYQKRLDCLDYLLYKIRANAYKRSR